MASEEWIWEDCREQERRERLATEPDPGGGCSLLLRLEWAYARGLHAHSLRQDKGESEAWYAMRGSVLTALKRARTWPRWPLREPLSVVRSKVAAGYLDAIDGYQDAGLLLLGPTGIGKTIGLLLLIRQLWNQAIDQRRPLVDAMFVKATAIAGARRGHPLGSGEPKLLTEAMDAGLLVLDDVGQEQRGDTALWELVDARYDRRLPVIATSGLTFDAFKSTYGEQLVRRIHDGGAMKGRIISTFAKQFRPGTQPNHGRTGYENAEIIR